MFIKIQSGRKVFETIRHSIKYQVILKPEGGFFENVSPVTNLSIRII